MRHPAVSSCARSSIALLLLMAVSSPAVAQSWLPAKGEGTVSVLFSNTLSTKHYLPDVAYDRGHIDANTMLFDVTYGISDRMAVTVGLPVVVSRYRGAFPHRPDGIIGLDDGNWHTSAQDFRMGVRYNVARGPIQITPFIGSGIPASNYEYFAHAAPGRQLMELATGVAVGRLFAELGLVVSGNYALNFSESALDYSRRFSTASVESAYFLTPSIRVIAMASGRKGHTGIDLPVNTTAVLTAEQFRHHDQISRESFFNVGAGAAFTLNDTTDLFFGFTKTVTGRNTHATDRGLSLGLSWSFGRPGIGDEPLANRDARQGSLVRCVCEKNTGA